MSILCCCRQRQSSGRDTHSPAIELPVQPPRARLSKTLSRSDTDMYISSLLASRDPSRLNTSTYHSIVDPEAVDVDDSDDDMQERDKKVSSPGTLGAFKTKLIRRLSHRAESKFGGHTSGGPSDEELARRAELKRLMHKRIQEELKNEEDDEDDIRYASPKQQSISKCGDPELPGGGPRDTIEFSVPGVKEERVSNEVAQGEPGATNKEILDIDEKPQLRQCQGSCAGPASNYKRNSCDDCNTSLKEPEPVSHPASPSYLVPVHLLGGSGRGSPSTASWRLSYSASHLDSFIDPLEESSDVSRPASSVLQDVSSSHDIEISHQQKGDTTNCTDPTIRDETVENSQITHGQPEVDTETNEKEHDVSTCSDLTRSGRNSPLDVWLRSQDMHCTSILSSRPNSGMALERRPELDAVENQSPEVHLTRNPTDLPEDKRQTTEPSSVLSEGGPEAWLKPPEGNFDAQRSLIAAPSNESVALHQILSQMGNVFTPKEPPTEDKMQDTSSRYTSSRYTTRPNSQQATPRDSGLSVTELPENSGFQQPTSTIYGPVSPYQTATSEASEASSYRTAINKMPSADLIKNRPGNPQLSVVEASSGNVSETASFKQREEELKSVKKRFGLTPTRRYPAMPVRSKFREEFEDLKGSSNARSSIFSKIYLALPKRARAASSQSESSKKSNEETKVPFPEFRKATITRPSVRDPDTGPRVPHDIVTQPITEESATGLWEGTLQQEVDRGSGWLRAKLTKAPTPKIDLNDTTVDLTPVQSEGSESPKAHSAEEERECSVEDCGPGPLNPAPPATVIRRKSNDPVDIHSGVLQEWVEQLQAEDALRQSRTASRITVPKRRPPRLRTPPGSWAKWPSNTREERTGPAGEKDRVRTRDFAVAVGSDSLGSEPGGRVSPNRGDITPSSRTLSSQVSKVFKAGWNKMVVHKGPLGRTKNEPIDKGSQRRRDFLEYPELELLPTAGCFKEVQALEQQIDTMKRRSVSGRRMMMQSSSDSTQRQLTSRIAEEVHKRQLEDENCHRSDGKYHGQYPSGSQFLTPAHALFIPRSKSCVPDMVGVPQSRLLNADPMHNRKFDDDDVGNEAPKRQDTMRLKRAKSTGNIDVKMSGDALPVDNDNQCQHKPVHRTWRSTLRRQKSLGWIHGGGGEQGKPPKEG